MSIETITIEGFPLSPQQSRVWALQRDGRDATYRARCAVMAEGDVTPASLKGALEEVVRRHEILRTTFRRLPGVEVPLQVIEDGSVCWADDRDLSGAAPATQERELDGLLRQTSPCGCADSGEGPTLHARVVTLSPRRHALLLSLPALCADAATLKNIVRELGLGIAPAAERDCEVLQYADFSEWQNQVTAEEEAKSEGEPWDISEVLEGPAPKLPFEAATSEEDDFEPDSFTFRLAAPVVKEIEERAEERAESVRTFILTCWQILLWHLAGESDILLGVGYDGRKYEELRDALGLFAKYLPLHIRVDGESKFSDVLAAAESAWRHGYQNQEYFNWEKTFKPNGGPAALPFFDFGFDFEEHAEGHASVGDIALSLHRHYVCIERFKLKLSCTRRAGELVAQVHYDSGLFRAPDIERLIERFRCLVESAADNPDAPVADLNLLPEAERRQILDTFNDTAAEYQRELCVHELFEQQVERTPTTIALVSGAEELTYAELNARANRLAHYLRERGVGADTPVGICFERSAEMVVAIIGTLKAGGCYVPLDPEYPQERLSFMLSDSGVRLLLTQQHLLGSLPEHAAEVVRLDADWEEIAHSPDSNLENLSEPESLAYMIYTSGSTGRPKGVMIPHRALHNHMAWMLSRFPLTSEDAVIQKTPFSFDASVWEFYAPLLTGARLVMAEPGGHYDPAYLVREMRERAVTTLQLVPSLLERLLEEEGLAGCGDLRRVFCGGEALAARLCERFYERWGRERVELYNLYGPTEATIDATYWECEAGRKTIPIGAPVSNTQVYVLDARMRLVPVGVAGELYIGGESLGRGYLNRPELTAERFVPHPFSSEPGGRLYKTGDVVRWNDEGQLEYLGRNDEQVKVRGYRIEVGEIEASLLEREEVGQAVVLVREEEGRGKQLAAFVCPSNGVAPDGRHLREYLQGRLPEYMVPASISVLGEMPLTANGKIDRQALLGGGGAVGEVPHEGARNEVEGLLAQVWGEVLGVEEVGVNDSFFELGGHSLLATQLISRIQALFQIELPIRTLFEAPVLADLAQEIEGILKGGKTVESLPLRPLPRNRELPLSFAQERLWFLDQLEPSNPFYNISTAMRITGPLDEGALERSLSEIVRRHESLRTTFTFDERPRQQITPERETSLPVIDLRGDPAEEQQPKVSALAHEEAQRPFDLSQGPLLRTTLLRLAEEESILLLTMHHVVSDGWSMGILIREITGLYEAFSKGRPSPLPDLHIQYADFAVWQRSWLQGSVFSRQLKYWKEQLAGLPPTLELPTDHPRPEVQTFRGAIESSVLPQSLADDLKAICRSEGVTLYMLMLAAFQVLLYRYTGQNDIAIGSPIANRNRKEVEGLIGFFINTLVMRTDLSGGPSFRQVLKRVREVTLGAYAHQDLPFEKLVEELKPVRDLSRQPLFQVMFAFQNTPTTKLEVAGLNFTGLEVDKKTVQFDWNVAMQEIDRGIILEWQYNTDLFEADTVRRMIGHLRHLLESIAARPEQPIAELELLPEAERTRLLRGLNDTAAEYRRELCVHELFEQQVERTPTAIALVSGAEELTYAELNSRANQLAHYLRERGVRADTPVGVCLERSAEMVVALLGVLKAGGCYVPLDPEYPRERLSFMLADSRVRLLLTQRRVAGALPQHAAEEVRLDADWEEIAQSPDMNLAAAAAPESLAYIIYTSGSTGRPKGVMIPRRALHNHMAWMLSRFPLTSEDAVIQKTPFSFDASVWEFYAPLLTGARLVMAEPGGHYDPEYLVQLIAAQGVTTLQVVPSLLERLLEEVEPGRCRSLRRVFCGGEALAARLVERFYERLGAELYNLYGPTEATIDATFWECAPSPARRSIPIGAPVSNTQVYVLDAEMRLVPAGVSGELYIGGESLGRGYLNRPELTAERFVPHPFSSEPGARLYKTGDVVRWNDEGELEYLGRNDEQVKVRGYRIEVGEIEASLLEREEVGQAVVLVKEEGRSKQLAAFVVPKGGEHVDAKELRGHLQGRLPEYMVPASIAVVGEMPLTPNGKIDRQALLSVKAEAAERASRYAGARNGVEELLARVWQEVLGVERIGIHDNFFELGGESILSIQVIARLRQEGLKLSLKQMFQHQTIAELARVVVSAEESSAEQFDSGDNVPLTPIQHRFFEQGLPNPHHFNQAVMLAADTRPDAVALTAVLHKLVSQHASLRLHFTPGEGEWRQAYAEAETPQLLWTVDLSHLSEDEAEQRQQLEAQAEAAQASLNITQGPLLRAVLFDLGARSGWRLLIVIHHLGVDGVSWRVLLEDLQRGYAQALAGKSVELPPPTATFRRWSQALHDYGSSERLRAEVGYWTDARRREVRRLPVDFAGGENTASSSQSVEFELGHEETRALLQEVPRVYHTQAQEALAAALALAFRKWTGETRLLVDFEGHGREEEAGEGVDVSRTVGWFTSVYPVLLEVTGEEVASALKAVKEQLRGVPGRGIGYGVLRYLSGEERVREALAGMPGAEVSLNYLGQFDRVLEGGRFRAASESVGAVQDVGGRREYLLTINALVADGRLRVSFGYSGGAHRRETIEVLGAGFVGALRGMIEHCGEEGAGGHTPSDFPLARLTQAQIDAIEVGQAGVEDIYGLSPLQQGLMFHSMYAPQSGLYVAQSSVRMRKLDKEAFQRAWQGVVDRHEILRTAFVADGLDRPVQVVLGDVPLSWHEQDLRGLSEAAVEQEINEYVEWDLAQGFDFARAPVMRLALLRVGEDEYQFVWSHHHVLLDGWSIPLLVKEVASFYEAYSRGEELELPKPRPYRDYMAWLAQQDGRAAEEFWRAQLRGVSEPTRLGIDRGAEAGVEEYGEHQVRLGEELTTKLREMGRRNQVTLNTIIQGAWALVLSRYSGETRVTFGTTVAGRPAELDGVGRMVGLFVNTVPLSVEVDEGESVISYLKQIQQKHVEIRQYEHTPLVKIQGWSEVARGVPLYENLFTFQNYPVDDKLWEQGAPKGLQVESVRTRARSHYPLAVRIAVEASMLIRMTYDRGRYSDASVKRMLGHLQYLLEEVGSDPSRRLSGLELLTPEERRMMLTGGGNASAQSA